MAMSAKLWLVLFIIVASCAAPAAEAPQRTQSAAVIPPRAPPGSTPSTTADVPQRVNAGPIPTQRVAPTPLAGLLAEFWSLAAAALNQEPLPRPPLPFEGLKPPHVYDREGAGLKPSQLELLGMVIPLDVVFRGKIEPNTVSSTLVVTPDWHSWTRFSTFDRWASWATPAPPAFAQLGEAVEALHDLMQEDEASVLILRRTCGLIAARKKKKDKVTVNSDKCLGDDCGCARFCTRVFGCPALIWDKNNECASVDEVVCTGCGVCAYLCPQGAIEVEKAEELVK